jgi:hypothetical protein
VGPRRISPAMGVSIAALVIAASGGAYAIGSGSSTITACVHHAGGGLYKAHHCAPHDTSLSWNVRGPRGPRGQRGLTGAHGLQGRAGPGAVKIDRTLIKDSAISPTYTTVARVGPWTIGFACYNFVAPNADLAIKGPGHAEFSALTDDADHSPFDPSTGGPALTTGAFTHVFSVYASSSGSYSRIAGNIVLTSGTTVAYAYVNLLSDARDATTSNWSCTAHGVAFPTS